MTDEKNLRLLSIFHYVVGGLAMLFSSMFLFHIVMGIRLLTAPASAWPFPNAHSTAAPPFPPAMASIFIAMGSVALLFGWTMGVLTILAGRSIAQRRRHLFCLIVAGLLCMWMPFGTVLGVFTLVMLTKSHVRMQFDARATDHAAH